MSSSVQHKVLVNQVHAQVKKGGEEGKREREQQGD
jgi:hypothetical protein